MEFKNSDGKWTSLIFPENKTRHEAEEYLNTIQTDIRRGIFNLPKKRLIPNLIEAGIVEKNPCKEVKRLKITQKKERVLSKNEISLLIENLHSKEKLMVLIGLFTGMRLNEVLSLRWSDFDFDKGILFQVCYRVSLVLVR